ncbi:MAG TPA: hypothetical protein VFY93_15950 [Planctomycetota bacterium]|nr:hypothetical protein [Planctomycetota bacterium]
MPPLLALLGLGSVLSTAFWSAHRWHFAGASVVLLVFMLLHAYRWRPSRRNRRIAWFFVLGTAGAFAYVFLATGS